MNSIDSLNSTDHLPIFFTSSTLKFIIMSIFTLGLYNLYWFYKNWQAIKITGWNCNPVIRTILAPIFAYSLFNKMQRTKNNNQLSGRFLSIILSIVYFIISIISNAPSPYWILTFLTFVPLIFANQIAIAANNIAGVNLSNIKFTMWNWLTILLGGLCIVLTVIGAIIPDTGT